MKNQRTLLCLGLAALVLIARVSLAQPAKPTPPERPAPAARPVPAPAPAPVPPDSIESQLVATEAAFEKAKMSYALADADWGKTFGRVELGSRTLVIPKDNVDTKDLAETEEDLNVMARILEKTASTRGERGAQAMGIFIHGPFSAQSGAQNLYIEGYGALFFLNVNYPLVAPPSENKEDTESKEQTSSEWEDTRRELFHPPGSEPDLNGPFAKSVPGTPAEKYDPDKVEALKKNLISGLKNAAHIRALKSDESVTVVVTTHGGLAGSKTIGRVSVEAYSSSQSGTKKSSSTKTIPGRRVRVPAEGSGTKLILRAKKSDIEAFQENKMDLDEFRKKVSVMMVEGT